MLSPGGERCIDGARAAGRSERVAPGAVSSERRALRVHCGAWRGPIGLAETGSRPARSHALRESPRRPSIAAAGKACYRLTRCTARGRVGAWRCGRRRPRSRRSGCSRSSRRCGRGRIFAPPSRPGSSRRTRADDSGHRQRWGPWTVRSSSCPGRFPSKLWWSRIAAVGSRFRPSFNRTCSCARMNRLSQIRVCDRRRCRQLRSSAVR